MKKLLACLLAGVLLTGTATYRGSGQNKLRLVKEKSPRLSVVKSKVVMTWTM